MRLSSLVAWHVRAVNWWRRRHRDQLVIADVEAVRLGGGDRGGSDLD